MELKYMEHTLMEHHQVIKQNILTQTYMSKKSAKQRRMRDYIPTESKLRYTQNQTQLQIKAQTHPIKKEKKRDYLKIQI